MSTIPEIVPFSETIRQTAQEGLGVAGQAIATSEMPEIGHSGETSQPGQEGLGVGGQVIGHSDVETIQPVVSGSTSEMSLGAGFNRDLKSEQIGGVQLKVQSSGAATQNPNGLDEMLTAGTKLQSVSEKESVEAELFEASEDSDWFDAKEKKGKKIVESEPPPEYDSDGYHAKEEKERKRAEIELPESSKDSEWFDAKEKKGEKIVEIKSPPEYDSGGYHAKEEKERKCAEIELTGWSNDSKSSHAKEEEDRKVEVELTEASKDSQWFDAIEKKNCKLLLQLFRSDRSLWMQTGLKGRSVLHVAVMQGCSELVRALYKDQGDLVACGKNWETPFEFLWENARDGRLKDASARDIWLVMEGPADDWYERELSLDRSGYDYIQSHVVCSMPVDSEMSRLREAISPIARDMKFEMHEDDVDFNFENFERKESYVHMACSRLQNVDDEEYWRSSGCAQIVEFIITVLNDLSEKNLLQNLFDQKDAQGRTILQILVTCSPGQDFVSAALSAAFGRMLAILPVECVNTLDKAGRTVLHWAVAHNTTWAVEELLWSRKARPDLIFQTTYILNITAFHLTLLYENDLWKLFNDSLVDELERDFCEFRGNIISPRIEKLIAKASLLWAILMGWNEFVKYVKEEKVDQLLYSPKENKLLAMAAWSGNVEILQLFLQDDDVDKLSVVCDPFEAPPLHLAVDPIRRTERHARTFNDWLHCNDFISIKLLEKKLREQNHEEGSAIANTDKTKYGMSNINKNQYSAKQACANLLLQAGADILATDKPGGHMADPGVWASNEARIWWYELVANETLNIKKDLNAAGTRTAVVATLVATASFVGPLTPPLNFVAMSSGTATLDVGVQVTELLIQVFLVSNSLSFYLAITSIMLAIMPSLPIPKEGLVFGPCDDLIRSRRTISIAIGILLASIISVLVSFAASSLAVIPLQHRRLMAYSTSIGGLICFVGIIFFFLRFLRLIWRQNTNIRKLYQRIGVL